MKYTGIHREIKDIAYITAYILLIFSVFAVPLKTKSLAQFSQLINAALFCAALFRSKEHLRISGAKNPGTPPKTGCISTVGNSTYYAHPGPRHPQAQRGKAAM